MRFSLSVMDVMTRTPVVVGPETTVEDAVKLMLKYNVGSLVVQENNLLRGILTEKDIVRKVVLKNLNPKKTKVSGVMSTIVVTVKPGVGIMEAIKLMTNYNLRRLPVVDRENELVGLVTINDILRVQPQLFELVLERSRLFASKKDYSDGECNMCKVYSSVKSLDGRFLCLNCERNERIINYLS